MVVYNPLMIGWKAQYLVAIDSYPRVKKSNEKCREEEKIESMNKEKRIDVFFFFLIVQFQSISHLGRLNAQIQLWSHGNPVISHC